MLQVCAVDFTAYHLLRPLLHGARDSGWNVEFACADGPLAAKLRAEGFRHLAVPITRSPSPGRLVGAAARLAAHLRREPPDLIHTHTPVGGLVGRAAALAWRGPVVHTFHGLPFEGDRLTNVERVYLAAERALARRTSYFFSQAQGDARRAAALGIARAADMLVIGNGVDTQRFRPNPQAREEIRGELGLPSDALVAVIVARLVREKGLLDLADAAASLTDLRELHVLVVGEPLASDRTGVAAELDEHPVVAKLGRRWRRLGHRDDVPEVLAAADLFVLPTYREGLPRSVIEAMAVGLPVVATNIPACRELVREGETGLLVPVRDSRALAAAISELIRDAPQRSRMGVRAREIVLREHDERTVIQRQLDVFNALIRS